MAAAQVVRGPGDQPISIGGARPLRRASPFRVIGIIRTGKQCDVSFEHVQPSIHVNPDHLRHPLGARTQKQGNSRFVLLHRFRVASGECEARARRPREGRRLFSLIGRLRERSPSIDLPNAITPEVPSPRCSHPRGAQEGRGHAVIQPRPTAKLRLGSIKRGSDRLCPSAADSPTA